MIQEQRTGCFFRGGVVIAFRFLAFALILFALPQAPALAATPIYVRTDGHDTNCNGTVDAPAAMAPNCAVLTITRAIALVDASGTINVAAGVYQETITINKSVTLLGATAGIPKNSGYSTPASPGYDWAGTQSIIRAAADADNVTITAGMDNITIDGFVFDAMNRSAAGNRNLLAFPQNNGGAYQNIIIRNSIFGPNTNTATQDGNKGRSGIVLYGPSTAAITDGSITGNLFFDIQGNGCGIMFVCSYSQAYGSPSPYYSDMTGTAISNNEFKGINRSGIEISAGCRYLTISGNEIHHIGALPTTTDPTQYSNPKYGNGITFPRGSGDVTNGAVANHSDTITISSNNIHDNEKCGVFMDALNSNYTISGNTLQNNGSVGAPYLAWPGIQLDLTGQYHSTLPNHEQYGGTTAISVSGNTFGGNGGGAIDVLGTPTNGFVMGMSGNDFNGDTPPSGDGFDTSAPTIIDNQSGDDTWRTANNGTYDVDFNDTGTTHLSKFTARACTTATNCNDILDWTDVVTGLSPADSYSTDWQLPAGFWNSLPDGKSYISLSAVDGTGNASDTGPLFYVNKDTSPPPSPAAVRDGTGADSSFTVLSGGTISANWDASTDPHSGTSRYWYAIGTTSGGTDVTGWTDNGTGTSVSKSGLTLTAGQMYYVSVKAENNAGLQSAAAVSNGQEAAAQGVCGDVDDDGFVRSNDVLVARRHVDGTLTPALTAAQRARADVVLRGSGNPDGTVDTADLQLISNAAIEAAGLTPAGLACEANP